MREPSDKRNHLTLRGNKKFMPDRIMVDVLLSLTVSFLVIVAMIEGMPVLPCGSSLLR